MISSMKALVIKNKSRQAEFLDIGMPPYPIVTRWGSWLSAVKYYCDNLPRVKQIVNNFEGGILVANAKQALSNESLSHDLLKICANYFKLIEILDRVESTDFSIEKGNELIRQINFDEDCCQIRLYIDRRFAHNDIRNIIEMKNESICPTTYAKIFKCQATSCSAERSFSILGKILTKDRNFSAKNIPMYIFYKINSALL